MTVVGRIRERRQLENPSYPLTSQALIDLFSRKVGSGVSVNEDNALTIPAVRRAVGLVTGRAAGLPLKLYRDMAGEREQMPTPTLLREPYPDVAPFTFFELLYTDLLLWGDSFHFKVRSEAGGPWDIVKLLRIPPYEVTVERAEATARNPSGKRFRIGGSHTQERYSPHEMMHVPAQGTDGLRGLGRIGLGAEALGVALAAEATAAKLFGDGLQFAGILSTDQKLTGEQAQGIASQFRQALAALGVGPKIPVLGQGTKFEKISMSSEEAQFIPAREFQITEVARLFDVQPAELFDPGAQMNYGEAQKQQALDYLEPMLQRVEQVTTMHLVPRGQFFEYTRAAFLRADTQTRFQTYSTAIQFGLMTRNECRALENLPPVEGGDDMLTPVNLGGAANEQPESGVSEEPGTLEAEEEPADV